MDQALALFDGSGVKIMTGQYLGAAIGATDFKTVYVSKKINKWVQDIEELSAIAVEEPQVALSAFTKGICHRWTFIQRTLDGIGSLFQPLEDCIRHKLIPSIVGRNVSDVERSILSLPVRYGGLGIANPVNTSEREYQASKKIQGCQSSGFSDFSGPGEFEMGPLDIIPKKTCFV